MTTPITPQRLVDSGFALVGSLMSAAVLGKQQVAVIVFARERMSIHVNGDSATAHKDGTELGPVSTMEQVQALDSVINPVPSDAITAEKLTALEWFRDGGMFWKLNFGIKLSDRPGCASTLSTIAGCKTIHLGYASTMSEVEALTAIANRNTGDE